MPRIMPNNGVNRISGSSTVYDPDAEDDLDLDTADRGRRDSSMRGPMHETRESQSDSRNTPRMAIPDIEWRQPLALDAPPPRPGYAQRWVRTTMRGGETDSQNMNYKQRIGWQPRDPSTIPEGELFSTMSTQAGHSGGVIRVGNLVLQEIPVELLKRQRRFNQNKAKAQEEATSAGIKRVSQEGQRQGYDPIVRDERTVATTGRRPPTLAD